MRIGWGWKIAAGYTGFVVMIICLVTASSRQNTDLVSKDYYKEEIKYQAVIDASRNQASLSGTCTVHANGNEIVVEFPQEFASKPLTGTVNFYSAANKGWDRSYAINATDNRLIIPRTSLQRTIYVVKVSYTAEGKQYYYQAEINLNTV